MARQQRSDLPFLLEFQNWICETHVAGCASDDSLESGLQDFIPDGEVHLYLKHQDRCLRILAELFDHDDIVVDKRTLLASYSKVFAILVKIGSGRYIASFLKHAELGDDRLPLSAKPGSFPSGVRFDAFRHEQFRFCAAVFDRERHSFESDRILPYLQKTEVGRGVSSVVHKIKVHGRHAIGPRFQDQSSSPSEPRIYALKEYTGQRARDLHDYEVNAFTRFGRTGIEKRHMVRFLCSYTQEGTYNAVLEFADLGTLEDFMTSRQNPSTNGEVLMFWTQFLQLVEAFVHMHDIQDPLNAIMSTGYVRTR